MAADLNVGMIERMKASGALRSAEIENAFRRTPRHLFVPGVALDLVYSGNSLVTRSDQKRGITSSSSDVPFMSTQLESLRVERGHRVLEIGAGTGYNAALLSELVGPEGEITTIDNQPDVAEDARAHLRAAERPRVRVITGDGYAGYAERAPYDRLIATASVRDVPLAWRDQMREGGLLMVPLRFGPGAQIVATFRRNGDALESVEAVSGGAMPLRTENEALEEPVRVSDLDVAIGTARDGDAEMMLEIFSGEPSLTSFDSYPGSALFGLGGIVEPDWIVMRARGRNGMWQGVLDRPSRSLAVVWPVTLPTGANRASVISYGGTKAAERLRALLTELAPVDVGRVRVDALPKNALRPEADVYYERANFTYAVNWRSARGERS